MPELQAPDVLGCAALCGRSPEESANGWVYAAAALDYLFFTTMEEAFGARIAHQVYSKVWEKLALGGLDSKLEALNLKGKPIGIRELGLISKEYWKVIDCPYEVVEETDDIHIGEITRCPYWDCMHTMYGYENASDMIKKGMGATTANYYQAIVKALGKWNEIYATMDRCICLGDERCRVIFKKREQADVDTPLIF